MLSGWVGDEDPTFKGLQNCLNRYLQSALAGKCAQLLLQCILSHRVLQWVVLSEDSSKPASHSPIHVSAVAAGPLHLIYSSMSLWQSPYYQ